MLDNVSSILDLLLTLTQNFLYTVITFALWILVTIKNLFIMVFWFRNQEVVGSLPSLYNKSTSWTPPFHKYMTATRLLNVSSGTSIAFTILAL